MLRGFAQHLPTQVKLTMALFFVCAYCLNRNEKNNLNRGKTKTHIESYLAYICCPFKMCQICSKHIACLSL